MNLLLLALIGLSGDPYEAEKAYAVEVNYFDFGKQQVILWDYKMNPCNYYLFWGKQHHGIISVDDGYIACFKSWYVGHKNPNGTYSNGGNFYTFVKVKRSWVTQTVKDRTEPSISNEIKEKVLIWQ
jgi:hypothetical protein